MPVRVTYPGVYVQEVSSGNRAIAGVSTSLALFVGTARSGPLGSARTITSYSDFDRIYATDPSAGEMSDQVQQFFVNGGQQAIVLRVGNATTASVVVQNERGDEALEITAANPGTDGNLVRVEVDFATPTPEASFNLHVTEEQIDDAGAVKVVAEERFTDSHRIRARRATPSTR